MENSLEIKNKYLLDPEADTNTTTHQVKKRNELTVLQIVKLVKSYDTKLFVELSTLFKKSSRIYTGVNIVLLLAYF
jgi:hypothetical protein